MAGLLLEDIRRQVTQLQAHPQPNIPMHEGDDREAFSH
jgi:hypothetical protein